MPLSLKDDSLSSPLFKTIMIVPENRLVGMAIADVLGRLQTDAA